MAIKTLTCPSCNAPLRYDASKPRRAVRCPKCQTTFQVPEGSSGSPESPEPRWFVARDKQKVGPYSLAQLKQLAVGGQLRPEGMILQEGQRQWMAASALKGLFPQGDGVKRRPEAAPPPPPPPRERASTPPPLPTRTRPAAPPPERDGEPAAEEDRPSASGMRWALIGGGAGVLALGLIVAVLYFTGIIGSRKAPTPAGPGAEVAGKQEQRGSTSQVVEASGSAPAGPGEKISEGTASTPRTVPEAAPASAPGKPLDLSFIAASFNGALVIHPARLAQASVLTPGLMKATGLATLGEHYDVHPGRVEQVVLLMDPWPGGVPPDPTRLGGGPSQARSASTPGGGLPSGGREFTSPEGRFSVQFPSPPKQAIRTGPMGNGSYIYTATDAASGVTYNVEVSDVPKNALAAGPEFYLKSMADILGKDAKSKRDVKAGDYPGFEVVTEPPGLPVRMTMRIYLVNGRQYQLTVSGPKDRQDPAQVAAFFDSFKPNTSGVSEPGNTPTPPSPGPGRGAAPAGARPAQAPITAFSFGGIIRFTAPTDGKQVLTGYFKSLQEKTFQGKTYFVSATEKMAGVPLAGFQSDDRTLLVAPEPTLHKMLTAGSTNTSPLRERLARLDLDNDVAGVFVMEPYRMVARVLVEQDREKIPPPLAGLAQLPDHLQTVEIEVNLSAGPLARLVLETDSDQSAAQARQLVDTTLGLARQFYPSIREQEAQAPPEVARPALAITDQIYGGIKVSQEGPRVLVQVDRPEGFGAEPPKGLIAVSGFNDDKGLESNKVPGSPFPLGTSNRPGGAGELGWAAPWPASPKATFEKEVVFEGDGALHVVGTENYARRWTVPQKGVFEIEQQVRVPKGGGIHCYVWKSPGSPSISTGPMWRVGEGTFKVHDGNQGGSGQWLDTGVRCEPDTWYKVTVRIDVAARHWEFFVNDQKFQAPHPLGFRFPVDALDGVNYLTEVPAGYYLDALIVRTAGAGTGQ